ncbi:MAG: CRISPR system precrRNA processing endoribonuclease RAMP protein Cas6 [Caldilineaceae bacterium]|nr:CRISPR system precrRNA processing endoribonuclease RAMP protein Cas6 [Caldilineaceae bacterium]
MERAHYVRDAGRTPTSAKRAIAAPGDAGVCHAHRVQVRGHAGAGALPGLVFGSLVERWNAFSPVTLSPEMRRFGEEMVAISRYHLQSRPVAQKNQGLRIGGVGEATYRALAGDRYWLGVMQMLADFALYSGVGVQTATGMGQVRHRAAVKG